MDTNETKLWQTCWTYGKLKGYYWGRRLGFESKACSFAFNGEGSTYAWCNVGISEHILS